jgi:hypothetical protein
LPKSNDVIFGGGPLKTGLNAKLTRHFSQDESGHVIAKADFWFWRGFAAARRPRVGSISLRRT